MDQISFKTCERCSGDQSLECDVYGSYLTCLSCGSVSYPDAALEPAAERQDERTAVNLG